MDPQTQADLDNHANQLNPNNEAYHDSRSNDEDYDDDDDNDIEIPERADNDADDFQEEWIPQDAW